MTRRMHLIALITFAFAFASRPAAAVELHAGLRTSPYAGSPRDAAEAFLRAETRSLDLASVDLVHRGTLALVDFRTVRFAQVHEGLPVLGAAVALRVAPDGRVTAAALQVARDLRVSPTPRVDQVQVRELLATQVGPRLGSARMVFTLAVLPGDRGYGRLVWQVDAAVGRGGWRYLVDAHRAELLHSQPLAVHALGRVYAISRVNTPTTSDVELLDLDPATPQVLTGWSGQLQVTNYVSGGVTTDYVVAQTLNPSSGDDFLYDPPADVHDATDGFAQVMLYYHLTRGRDYFSSTHGVDFTPAAWSVLAIANMTEDGTPYDNAFFAQYPAPAPWNTSNLIVVGQGTSFDFADDSDVFLHEFTHYVSANAMGFASGFGSSEYGRSPFALPINEGLADFFSCTVNGNPILGETSLAPFGLTRDLTKTTKVCPTDMTGEEHDDGEIIGSLSWTLREAFGQAAADKLVWGAMSLLVPGVTFGDYGQALIQSGNDLVAASVLQAADVQTITDALAARGLDECFAEIPLREGEPRISGVRGLTYLGLERGQTCGEMRVDRDGNPRFRQTLFHFATTPEATDVGLKLKVQFAGGGGANLAWKIYGHAGQHVGFTTEGHSMTLSDYDWMGEESTATSGEMVVDATTTPPFDPAQSHHFLVMHQNCPDTQMTVSYERLLPVQDDAGVGEDATAAGDDAGGGGGGGDKGCGCRTAGGSGATAAALLLVLGVLVARRRRGATKVR